MKSAHEGVQRFFIFFVAYRAALAAFLLSGAHFHSVTNFIQIGRRHRLKGMAGIILLYIYTLGFHDDFP